MSRTPYSRQRQIDSDIAHSFARVILYPRIFGTSNLSFTNISVSNDNIEHKVLDGQMAVDRLVDVNIDSFKHPLSFMIQERFRKPKFSHYRDVTITEWNYNSNLPSELYKIKGGIFLYGYFSITTSTFIEAVAFYTDKVRIALMNKSLSYERGRNDKNQTFIAIKFDDLFKLDLILFHVKKATF